MSAVTARSKPVAPPADDALPPRSEERISSPDVTRLDLIRRAEATDPTLVEDPVWRAFVDAPEGPAETAEQRQWSAQARAGEGIPGDEMTARIAARCARGR